MEEGEQNYSNYDYVDPNMKLRDIEEKQRILKDRVLLIGQNMIESKERDANKIIEIKKDIEILKESLERMRRFLETVSEEFSKFATKEELKILLKQTKMFN